MSNSSGGGGGGELFRISLGPAANSVTSHLCNLEGLACTGSGISSTESSDLRSLPICDPNVTHSVFNEQHVPRVLFVDGRDCFDPWKNIVAEERENYDSNNNDAGYAWKGKIATYHRLGHDEFSSVNSNRHTNQFASSSTMNHGDDMNLMENLGTMQSDERMMNPNLISFQSAAMKLLQSKSYSNRYQVFQNKTHQVSSKYVYSSLHQHQRHVDWDSNEDDEHDDDDDDENSRRQHHMNANATSKSWREANQLTQTMEESWDAFLEISSPMIMSSYTLNPLHDNTHSSPPNTNVTSTTTSTQNQMKIQSIPWMCYFMPPHPSKMFYTAPLPINCNRIVDDSSYLYSYNTGYGSSSTLDPLYESHWHEHVLGEALRKNMESCDAIRGFQVMIDDDLGIFGGIACHTLQVLEDECKSAAKFVVPIKDGTQRSGVPMQFSSLAQASEAWRSEQEVRLVLRSQINSCMNLHGLSQYADLILPLSLNACVKQDFQNISHASSNFCNKSLFLTSAYAAMSMETGTLPYRLNGKSPSRSMIGLLNRYFDGSGQGGDDWYSSLPKLTFHEFVASLKPTTRHSLLELSSLVHPSEPQHVKRQFFHGTSIDRQMKKIKGYRELIDTSIVQPGGWLDDYGVKNGIMTSWTPMIHPPQSERSIHRHFAMSSTFRGDLYDVSPLSEPLRNHTSALMEALGIRYRPESCVGAIVNQSLFEIANSPPSAAGTYWKGLLKREGRLNTPEISVFSNSTRVYPYLHESINGMTHALSRKNYGYVTQDTMSGILPERDDLKESLESCLDLREMYEPPPGSGLLIDTEGTYFDDNLE